MPELHSNQKSYQPSPYEVMLICNRIQDIELTVKEIKEILKIE